MDSSIFEFGQVCQLLQTSGSALFEIWFLMSFWGYIQYKVIGSVTFSIKSLVCRFGVTFSINSLGRLRSV